MKPLHMDKKESGERNVLIHDMAGGIFDVSTLTIENGILKIKAITGDTHLEGEDFDNRILYFCVQDMIGNRRAVRRWSMQCNHLPRRRRLKKFRSSMKLIFRVRGFPKFKL